MKRLLAIFLLAIGLPALAQTVPQIGEANPRLQSVRYVAGERVLLTALPESGLTVMLEPGEQIQQVTLGTQFGYQVRVSAERDSFLVLPEPGATPTTISVASDRRSYEFDVRTGNGLLAAYLVQFEFDDASAELDGLDTELLQRPSGPVWSYRLKGDRSVRPSQIVDDGNRTWISFGADQALPAVFAIGANGKELVVNGHMRGSDYVIDRVHSELIFRIDKEKATAKRAKSAGDDQ